VVTADDLNRTQRGYVHDEVPITDGRTRLELWSRETYKFQISRHEIGLIENAKENSPSYLHQRVGSHSRPPSVSEAETTR
jgi:hypothetical protein